MEFNALREIELFQNLDEIQLAHLGSIVHPLEIEQDSVIFRQGQQPEFLYVIFKGRVRISSISSRNDEEALAILDEGTYFGEMKLIDDSQPYAVQALAHTDCVIAAFPLTDLRDLLGADRDLAVSFLWNMVQTLSRRLQAANEKVSAMARLSSPV